MDEGKTRELSEYRKKRKRRILIRRVSIILVLALLVTGAYFGMRHMGFEDIGSLMDYLQKTTTTEKTGFPVRLTGEDIYSLDSMGDTLVLLTGKNLYLYNESGQKLQQMTHGYTNARLQVSSNHTLVYDLGGNKFRVDKKTGTVYNKELTEEILFAALSPDGYAAVVTQAERHANTLLIYDKEGTEIYRMDSTELITAVEFTNNSRGCVVATLSASGGNTVSNLYGFVFNSRDKQYEVSITGSIILSIDCKANGTFGVICDNATFILNDSGEITGQNQYARKLLFFDNSLSRGMVLVFGNELQAADSMMLLNMDGTVKANQI
ncbi:MAG TPA: hypothetical protein H9671_05480, partial [Firmicutes bacterium]|nr:hypothetical protein [Bacillota bacterium]